MTDTPMNAILSADLKYEKSSKEITVNYDSHNLERFVSKIETIGFLRKKKFLIECDGNGNFKFREIKSFEKILAELLKLLKNGKISEKEFKKMKKNISTSL